MGRANTIMAVAFMHGLYISVIHSLSILCKCILFHVSVISHFSSALNKTEWSFLSVEADRFYLDKVPVGLLYFAVICKFYSPLKPFPKNISQEKKKTHVMYYVMCMELLEKHARVTVVTSSSIYIYDRFAVCRTVFCFLRILFNVFSSHSPLSPSFA